MINLNRAIIAGGCTRDPELRTTTGGIQVVSFSVATNRKHGEKEHTEYHDIVAFGKLAESTAQYLKKGMTALVEGHLQTRSWEKDGVKKYKTEIIAESVKWLSPKPKDASTVEEKPEEEREPADW